MRFGLTWFRDQPERKGKLLPVDLDAYERDDTSANLACYTTVAGTFMVRVLGPDGELFDYEHRRMPHFATCVTLARRRASKSAPSNVIPFRRPR